MAHMQMDVFGKGRLGENWPMFAQKRSTGHFAVWILHDCSFIKTPGLVGNTRSHWAVWDEWLIVLPDEHAWDDHWWHHAAKRTFVHRRFLTDPYWHQRIQNKNPKDEPILHPWGPIPGGPEILSFHAASGQCPHSIPTQEPMPPLHLLWQPVQRIRPLCTFPSGLNDVPLYTCSFIRSVLYVHVQYDAFCSLYVLFHYVPFNA
jgi:hypothetical protein